MNLKENLKHDWVILLILALPFVIMAYFWNSYPAEIPMHWSFSGQVDRLDPKIPGLFYLPLLSIVLYIVFIFLPKLDPKGKNYELFAKFYQIIKVSMAAFMTFLFMVITATSLGIKINVMYADLAPIILLFLVMGNFMGTVKPNYFVGFRLPWTLNNEEVWRLTHRLAGFIWVWSSLLMMILLLVFPERVMAVLFWVYVGAIVLVPSVYSYLTYKKITAGDGSK
jgi:uncharacterized membrane protein